MQAVGHVMVELLYLKDLSFYHYKDAKSILMQLSIGLHVHGSVLVPGAETWSHTFDYFLKFKENPIPLR